MMGGGGWGFWGTLVLAVQVAFLWLWDNKWGFFLGGAVALAGAYWITR